jgi:hypothetical protein
MAKPVSTDRKGGKKQDDVPADHADVRRAALTMLGKALIPESVIAITKGEEAAVPVERLRRGSLLATNIPTVHTPST